jgi:hypothetical protein
MSPLPETSFKPLTSHKGLLHTDRNLAVRPTWADETTEPVLPYVIATLIFNDPQELPL